VGEDPVTKNSTADLQAPPIEEEFTFVKTQAVKEEVKPVQSGNLQMYKEEVNVVLAGPPQIFKEEVKTGSPPLIDLGLDSVDVGSPVTDGGQVGDLGEKPLLSVKHDIMEATTSFNTASPQPLTQDSVTEQLHNGYDK
jgi:hypothetical protein